MKNSRYISLSRDTGSIDSIGEPLYGAMPMRQMRMRYYHGRRGCIRNDSQKKVDMMQFKQRIPQIHFAESISYQDLVS